MSALEQEVMELKERLGRLETTVRHLARANGDEVVPPPQGPDDVAGLLAWLKAQGRIAELPPEAHEAAARWRALPEAEKEEHQYESA